MSLFGFIYSLVKVSNFPDISGLFISQMNSHIMIENTCLTIFIANLDKYLKSHSLMKLLLLIAFQNHKVGIFRKYEVSVRFATSFVKASRSINVQIARMDTWDGMQKRS